MTDDKLTALAARLRDHASDYITHPDDACKHSDLIAAAEYLRQCAQADVVEALRDVVYAYQMHPVHLEQAIGRASAVLAAQGGGNAE